MKSRAQIFEELTKKAADTYRRKNADYGDSFVKVRDKYPNSVLIRLNDKLTRLETLIGREHEAQVNDESVDDTLIDLANYALMELTERLYEKQDVACDVAPCADYCTRQVVVHGFGQSAAPVAAPAAGSLVINVEETMVEQIARHVFKLLENKYGGELWDTFIAPQLKG